MHVQHDSTVISSCLVKAVENIFDNLNLPFFLGGSRRFRYDHSRSDTDLFVLVQDKQDEAVLVRCLGELSFMEKPKEIGYSMNPAFRLIMTLGSICHVVILTSRMVYESISEDHERVAHYVASNPILQEFARELGQIGVSGSHTYRALAKLSAR